MARVAKKNREKKEKAEEILPVNAVSLPLQRAEAIVEGKNIPDDAFLTREEFEKLLGEVKNMTFEEVLARSEMTNLSPGQKVHMLKSWAERQRGGVVAVNNEPGFLKTLGYGTAVIAKKAFVTTRDGAPSWFFHVWSVMLAQATRYRIYKEKYEESKKINEFNFDDCPEVFAPILIYFVLAGLVTVCGGGIHLNQYGWNWFHSILLINWLIQLTSLIYEIGRKNLKDSNK